MNSASDSVRRGIATSQSGVAVRSVGHQWPAGSATGIVEWPAEFGMARSRGGTGVWYRLLSQAGPALAAAHGARTDSRPSRRGLIGANQRRCLEIVRSRRTDLARINVPGPEKDISTAGDLAASGRLAADWLVLADLGEVRQSEALPPALDAILRRLTSEKVEDALPAPRRLSKHGAGADEVPANAAAWDRFVKAVREQSTPTSRSANPRESRLFLLAFVDVSRTTQSLSCQ